MMISQDEFWIRIHVYKSKNRRMLIKNMNGLLK